MTTPSTPSSSFHIYLFKQLKNNETFLDIPAVAPIHQFWQLLGNSLLGLQSKPTLWRNPANLCSLFACKVINSENLEAKARALITRQTKGAERWTAQDEMFLLCEPGWYPHHALHFLRDGKGAPQVSLKGLRGDPPPYPLPHVYDLEMPFDKHTVKLFILLKSEINLLKFRGFPPWDIPGNPSHYW